MIAIQATVYTIGAAVIAQIPNSHDFKLGRLEAIAYDHDCGEQCGYVVGADFAAWIPPNFYMPAGRFEHEETLQ